jgi:hypothetical protein
MLPGINVFSCSAQACGSSKRRLKPGWSSKGIDIKSANAGDQKDDLEADIAVWEED